MATYEPVHRNCNFDDRRVMSARTAERRFKSLSRRGITLPQRRVRPGLFGQARSKKSWTFGGRSPSPWGVSDRRDPLAGPWRSQPGVVGWAANLVDFPAPRGVSVERTASPLDDPHGAVTSYGESRHRLRSRPHSRRLRGAGPSCCAEAPAARSGHRSHGRPSWRDGFRCRRSLSVASPPRGPTAIP